MAAEDAVGAPPPNAPRLVIEHVAPVVDGGRHPLKRIVGDVCRVEVDILREGHDVLAGRVAFRGPGDADWRCTPLTHDFDRDRWHGSFVPDRVGRWTYTIEAWTDRFATWQRDVATRAAAGVDVALDFQEGGALVAEAADRASDCAQLARAATTLGDGSRAVADRLAIAADPALAALVAAHLPPADLTRLAEPLTVIVDRERARFAAWYEMFPRSQTTDPKRPGTLADAARRLPAIAALGFDVVYLPPIHPIGVAHRKGPNGAVGAGPDDPGSPWAIGAAAGGHTAIEPALGTLADFDAFVQTAATLGLEVALDFAPHCSPDHPWVREHPDWFAHRADGTIKCAENPPYTFDDIVPLDFWCADRDALWSALRDVLRFWAARGVRTFRVDNPHTKPYPFWEWVIAAVKDEYPDAIFLAEAFTRPKPMRKLAALGFSQSYTYFIWRTTAAELRDYLTELTQSDLAEFFRGALFPTTPDVLPAHLQTGGRPAFRARLLLAATLSPLYGIYSGYELCEATPLHPGSEEFLDSEKFQIRVRDWDAPGNLNDDLRALNGLRREHPALQHATNLAFHRSENDAVLCYSRSNTAPAASLVVAVNLDPHHTQETMIHVPLELLGLADDATFTVEDCLSGERYTWSGRRNYVRLDPAVRVGQIFRVVPA